LDGTFKEDSQREELFKNGVKCFPKRCGFFQGTQKRYALPACPKKNWHIAQEKGVSKRTRFLCEIEIKTDEFKFPLPTI